MAWGIGILLLSVPAVMLFEGVWAHSTDVGAMVLLIAFSVLAVIGEIIVLLGFFLPTRSR